MKKLERVIVLACLLLVCIGVEAQQRVNRPNIVFILADDLGWADLSCYGNRFNESPHIDKLAAGGMRFTNAYAAAPVCSPTRASILSGQYPARVGIIDFIPGHWRPYEEVVVPKNLTQYLPAGVITMAEALKKGGYATGYFGKWHLGNEPEHHPLNQGFDEANVGVGYYNVRYTPPRETSKDKISSEHLADFGIEFITRNKGEPFFLFLSYYDVHVPYDAKDELIAKFIQKKTVADYPCNALYAASIAQLDQSVGRILKKLEEEDLVDNTLVVFVSDNGGSISENKYAGIKEGKYPVIRASKRHIYDRDSPLQYIGTSNTPLRNEKGTVYEGGIRVPLIVSWPGNVQQATTCDAPVTSVDFFPTFADVAEVAMPDKQVADGLSIKPLFFGNEISRAYVYWHYPVYHHDVPAAAIRNHDWKLVQNLVTNSYALYNLKFDLSETTDLSEVYPDKTTELLTALSDWQRACGATFPSPNSGFDQTRRFLWENHPDR